MPPPSNVLYVVLEDFSTLGSPVFAPAEANELLNPRRRHTPHLEWLAARGTVFRHAYCQSPICNPSRTSFMTSRRPSVTRVFTNDDLVFPSLPTMVDFLKATKKEDSQPTVVCAGKGKIFHIACDVEPHGFEDGERRLAHANLDGLLDVRLLEALNASGGSSGSGTKHTPLNSRASTGFSALRRTLQRVARAGSTKDEEKTIVAARLLAHHAQTRRRFFLAVGLSSTHVHGSAICIPNAASAEAARPLGKAAQLAPRRSGEHAPPLLTWPNWDLTRWVGPPTRKQLPRFDVDAAWERQAIGEYYACATHVDAQIGALLDALELFKLAQKTAVVVQGDHGFSLGRHGRWSKYNLYEDATRVPLIIAIPGSKANVVNDIVESLDVMPTILDLWGVARAPASAPSASSSALATSAPTPLQYQLNGVPVLLEGKTLMPFLLGSSKTRHPRAYARSEMREWMVLHRPLDRLLPGAPPRYLLGKGSQLYVRTAKHAYATYVRPLCATCGSTFRLLDETLYDLHADPGEMQNLAHSPSHAVVRRELLVVVMRDWNVSMVQHLNGRDCDPLLAPNRTQRLAWLRWELRGQTVRVAAKTRPRPVFHAGGAGKGTGRGASTRGRGRGKGRGGARRRGRH